MRIDTEDLRRQYESLTDEALLELDRNELVDAARKVYDEEVAQRKLARQRIVERPPEPAEVTDDEGELEPVAHTDGEPDWLEHAVCVCTFRVPVGSESSSAALDAQMALRAVGIPCHLTRDPGGQDSDGPPMCNAMVPNALLLSATSVLDRDLFNQEYEDNCRTYFESLSDEELGALDPEILSAGLLDKVARLSRAYEEELARRG